MNLTLRRTSKTNDGIFSILLGDNMEAIAVTVEHAYDRAPKLSDGVYTCQRGTHQLAHQKFPFTTFEVEGVPGHSNILFHTGNTQADSEGCILLGRANVGLMVTDSRATFNAFMSLQDGVDSFTLTVKS